MADKQRYQNPVVGDNVILKMFTYNSNNRADFSEIVKVDIYYLDPNERCESNPHGKRLIESIAGSEVVHDETGLYSLSLVTVDPTYVIGNYVDEWTVIPETNDTEGTVSNKFTLYPDLWFTSDKPVVYDFDFNFMPNRIRNGAKRFLIIGITPNVPKASDLERYYTNLAIVSPITISIEQACGECMPAESDLRLIVDNEEVELREACTGYYFLDTVALDLDCGIYNVWFQMDFGDNRYISDKLQLQIY